MSKRKQKNASGKLVRRVRDIAALVRRIHQRTNNGVQSSNGAKRGTGVVQYHAACGVERLKYQRGHREGCRRL